MTTKTADVTLTDNSGLFLNALPSQIKTALTAVGMAAESNAKKEITKRVYNTPQSKSGYVRTGRLRNSISNAVAESENAVYIGSNVEYAAFVELGTSRMIARPYISPAATQHSDEYKKIVEAVLKGTTP